MKLDITEFVMLAGTELAIQMIRNRVTIEPDAIEAVMEFTEEICVGLYHIRLDPKSYSYIYFENPVDKDNVISLCQKISSTECSDSKYH